jgi:hypothetical protein
LCREHVVSVSAFMAGLCLIFCFSKSVWAYTFRQYKVCWRIFCRLVKWKE